MRCKRAYTTHCKNMLELLNKLEFIVFTTRDFATASHSTMSAASKRLDRLTQKRFLTRVTRGIWANESHPYFHPSACVPYLLGKEQGYVSFLTALHLYSLISQIPRHIQIATTGRARILKSPVGQFEFLKMKPEFMQDGIEWSDTRQPYLIATKEKALLDVLYISTRRKRRFAKLPELDLGDSGFRHREFGRLLRELPYPIRIRSAIESRWQSLKDAY
jgi:predicted transcriptional regulator of viral defense system